MLQGRRDVLYQKRLDLLGEGFETGAGASADAGGTMSWKKMELMTTQYAAHRILLRRAVLAMDAAMKPENEEVDNMMSEITDEEANSQDKCPMQLATSEKSLQSLFQSVKDLGSVVNSSEARIESEMDLLTAAHDSMRKLREGLQADLAACEGKNESKTKLLSDLTRELEVMRQIGDGGLAEIQVAASRNNPKAPDRHSRQEPMSIADAKATVGTTKHLAQTLASCLAQARRQRAGGSEAVALYQIPQNGTECKTGDRIHVKLGGTLKDVTPDDYLQNGESHAIPCSDVNPSFAIGSIKMRCQNGYMHVDLSGCRIHVIIRCIGYETLEFTIKADAPMETVMKEFCNRTGIRMDEVQFIVDGVALRPQDSALSLGLEGDVFVDVTDDPDDGWKHGDPSEEYCKEEKDKLLHVYKNSYQRIAEEKSRLEEEVASTECEDTAREAYKQNMIPEQRKQSELSDSLSTLTRQLQSQRGNLRNLVETEQHVRDEIAVTAERCETMDSAIDALGKVGTALHILDLCPGLGDLQFNLPKFGKFADFACPESFRDAEIDGEMYKTCKEKGVEDGVNYRPAATSELRQGSIDFGPETNTQTLPLMATCPGCTGISDQESGLTHPSGNARTCWDPGAPLTKEGMRRDCSGGIGRKVIVCVADQVTIN
jgi:hypothetical protein